MTLLSRAITRLSRVRATQQGALRIEERLQFGPKKTLLLVSCHGRRFLVATAGETIAPLIEVRMDREASAPKRARRSRARKEHAE
jgi:flagellar biogenesis protein FliO